MFSFLARAASIGLSHRYPVRASSIKPLTNTVSSPVPDWLISDIPPKRPCFAGVAMLTNDGFMVGDYHGCDVGKLRDFP